MAGKRRRKRRRRASVKGLGWILLIPGALALFVADGRNREALEKALENAAEERPLMKEVVFKIPFLPDPRPRDVQAARYDEGFAWADDYRLRMTAMDDRRWQSPGLNLNDGREITTDDDEWQAHFRFAWAPPDDILHPGYSIVAADSPQHILRFAPLGPIDYDSLQRIDPARLLSPAPRERPAAWNLEAGDVVWVQMTLRPPAEASAGAVPQQRVAKVRIRKLSREEVRFDFVYRRDGQTFFPLPRLATISVPVEAAPHGEGGPSVAPSTGEIQLVEPTLPPEEEE
jgi:hypothetical protein